VHPHRVLLSALLGALLLAAGCRSATESPGHRGRVRVAAASDLNAALTDVIARFGGTHDVDVSVSYGSSGTFYAQLLNQAPFDLFLSADVTYPNQLDWSLSGLYWSSLSDFYSFVLFMLVPPRPAYAGLMLAAALYLAIFGPRGPKTIRA